MKTVPPLSNRPLFEGVADVNRTFLTGWNTMAEQVHQTAVNNGWWDDSRADLRKFIESQLDNDSILAGADEVIKLIEQAHDRKLLQFDRNDGEQLALWTSEISELLEGLRAGNPPDEKLPQFSNAEIEAADLIIRVMDTAKKKGWRVAEAIIAKDNVNKQRGYKHGGKAF